MDNHNEGPVIRFCSYPYCSLSRYLCQTCLEQNLHNHAQENLNHIVDPQFFKTQVDEGVKELKEMLHLYQQLESKTRNIWDISERNSDQLYSELKKQQNFLQYLISQTDIQNTPITMISERHIQYGSQLIPENIINRHIAAYRQACQYYENVNNTLNQLTPQLQELQNQTQKLQIDNVRASNYTKTIIQNLKVPILQSKISRDEMYFVFTNCIKELYIYDIKQNNMVIQYTGMMNQVTSILFVEKDNNLILGDKEGIIFLYKFNKYKREIIEQQQWDLKNGGIRQIFDMNEQNEFLVYCINGRILIIDIIDKQIKRQFDAGYQHDQHIAYSPNLQIIGYSMNGQINLHQIQNFDLVIRQQHEYNKNRAYSIVFSINGNYLALFSQDYEFLEIYLFHQKPYTKLSLIKSIQLLCITIQWVMNDDCLVIQTIENTKILNAQNFEDIKIIQTETINLNQYYESKQISYIIDFEVDQIVRYDC